MTETDLPTHLVYEARSIASLNNGLWRLESRIHGLRNVDVLLDSVPPALRKPGMPLWVVWNRVKSCPDAIFARKTDDGAELPDEWRQLLISQRDEENKQKTALYEKLLKH